MDRVSARAQVVLKWSGQVRDFFRGLREEFISISWTPRKELLGFTRVVIVAILVFGMAIYGMDVVTHRVLAGCKYLIRLLM